MAEKLNRVLDVIFFLVFLLRRRRGRAGRLPRVPCRTTEPHERERGL